MNRYLKSSLILFAVLLAFSRPLQAGVANVLGNPGFENAIGGSGNWNNTANRGINIVTSSAAEGTRFLRLDESTTSGSIDGVFTFQTISPAHPGDFVSFSGLIRANSLDSGDAGQIQIEFQDSGGTQISAINTGVSTTSSTFSRIAVSGVAPVGTSQITFTIRIQPANSGGGSQVDYDAMEATIGNRPIVLRAAMGGSLQRLHPGQLAMVGTRVLNVSTDRLTNADLVVESSPGLNILPNRGFADNRRLDERQGSLIYSLGNISAGQDTLVNFPLLVSSGALPGKRYTVKIFARANGQVMSDTLYVVVLVDPDPLFDEGTILGKVFDDRDEDGVQSKGEMGVPGVRLATEYGVSVVTDENGQFHIPAVSPGRHVLKIDGHTLPPGTRFITEESLLIKTTPGLLNKVRFAVRLPESALPEEFRKGLHAWVTQGVDLTRPKLEISLEPDVLKTGLGRLDREPTFRIKSNYLDYITAWRIEIQNEMGEKIWTGVGVAKPPSRVPWNGMTDAGEMIRPGVYAYRLIVRDSSDHEDWTPLYFFRVLSKAEDLDAEKKPFEIPSVGNFNIFKDGKRSISLVAKPALRVYGKTEPNRRVQVNGMPVDVGPDGEFQEEFFVTPGDKTITIKAANPEGDTLTQEQKIQVKNSSFFLVALGEEELGVNFNKGNQEAVARDDSFHEDFYQAGKLAYYLKAKIKGKFLVKSHYDTRDKRSQFFTQLDPDDYYPIYGDYSQISYEGQESKQRLFLLVEMDRSFLQWGSYETDFTDTELARYNRTLSGLKIHHETLSSTKYGDAKRAFTLFWAKSDTVADHNEFRATGGSLYYLRNRNLVQGGEKIRVETRDKIQDLPLDGRDLVYGRDYEIDYRQGRILLKQPLSSIAASQTVISNDILDGNPVYLIVDYEFEGFNVFPDQPAGIRGYTHFGDHIRIGGTAVEEQRNNTDYDLRSVDTVIRSGRNTKVTMEYAEAKFQQVQQALSFDGGLSFQQQGPLKGRRPREKAYLIKAESKPLEPLEVSGYLQDVEPGFSVDRIKSQEGFRKYGIQAKAKASDHFSVLLRHDSTEVAAQLRPLGSRGHSASFEKLVSTTAQALFDDDPWKVTGEYLHQHLDIPLQNRINSIYSDKPFGNAVGLKVARRVSDWLTPYFRSQYSWSGKDNFQAGGGVEVKAGGRATIYFEEMLGTVGDETLLGINAQQDEKTTHYATLKVRNAGLSTKQVATTIGTSHRLSEQSRIYTEREYSTYSGNLPSSLVPTFVGDTAPPGIWSSDAYGYETHFWDRWDFGLRFERRHLDPSDFRNLSDVALDNKAQSNTYNTVSTSWGYTNPKRFKFSDLFEVRAGQDAPELTQWLTQNSVEWKVNQDLSFLGRLNFGSSRFLEPGQLRGRFTELGAGFAYRPVETDRFNWLAKYTFLDEHPNQAQVSGTHSGSFGVDERAHILAVEGAYELTPVLQMVEKLAYRLASVSSFKSNRVWVSTFLWVNRFNFHVTRKWDLGVEYRMLFQDRAAESLKHGPLVELDRELYDYVRLGIGYNFTDIDDDLRNVNDFQRNGIFVRLSGKV